MRIRLYNARILTMEKERAIFKGEIGIEGDRILFVRKEDAADDVQTKWDREIDCEENLLMPGFKNAHTHSGMTFLRSYADDLPLDKWLQEKVFPAEKMLTAEDIFYLVKLAVLEYLSSGITSVFDMYLMPDITAHACMDMGMRCVLTSGFNNFTSSVSNMKKEYEKWNHTSPLISYQLGFHAEYTTDKEKLEKLASLVHKLEAPVFAHMCETAKEVADCKARYGMTPVVFLDSLGMFTYGGGGFHCVYVSKADMDVLRKRRLFVVTNPSSNTKLASGIAPVASFLKKGIPVAIGTDGPASNNCLDMFREMFLVSGLAKLREKDAACVDALQVLRMATVDGAKVMNLPDADILAKGKLADIIMIDLNKPNMRPLNCIEKNIVYSGSKQNVKMTMIGGRILYYNGKYELPEPEEAIYREAEAIAARIFNRQRKA